MYRVGWKEKRREEKTHGQEFTADETIGNDRMKAASHELDLLIAIELVHPIGQTQQYFVNKLVNPYASIK